MKIEKNVPLAPLSTFDIGGVAENFVEISNEKKLKQAIGWAKKRGLEHKICADASNIVFPDDTLEGLLIRIVGGKIKRNEKNKLIVDAGVNLLEFINHANSLGLAGLETLAGIPGTVGGAVVGNAGAYGAEISEPLTKVLVFSDQETKWITKKECRFDYRESVFKHSSLVVLKTEFQFNEMDPKHLQTKSQKIIRKRRKKYKPDLKCPGSFFKNVLVKNVDKSVLEKINKSKIIGGKVPAGYLLEEVGAKNMEEGGIQIADFHGNLFINRGGGTARDVKRLAQKLKECVFEKFGIELEEEVRYMS